MFHVKHCGFLPGLCPCFSLLDVREGDLKEGGALFRLPFSVMGVVGIAKDGAADFVLGSMRMHSDW